VVAIWSSPSAVFSSAQSARAACSNTHAPAFPTGVVFQTLWSYSLDRFSDWAVLQSNPKNGSEILLHAQAGFAIFATDAFDNFFPRVRRIGNIGRAYYKRRAKS
jgi:hypothetical protein